MSADSPSRRSFAVRRARASESGRWVICRTGYPNDVRGSLYLTRWGALRVASRWARQDATAEHMEKAR